MDAMTPKRDGSNVVAFTSIDAGMDDPAAIDQERQLLQEHLRQTKPARLRLQELNRLDRRKRGRPTKNNSHYEALFLEWEADVARRPNLSSSARARDFFRKGVPKKCGLNIGKTEGALRNARARGRWARLVRIEDMFARRSRISLLTGVAAAPPRGCGWLVPRLPAYLKKRKRPI